MKVGTKEYQQKVARRRPVEVDAIASDTSPLVWSDGSVVRLTS